MPLRITEAQLEQIQNQKPPDRQNFARASKANEPGWERDGRWGLARSSQPIIHYHQSQPSPCDRCGHDAVHFVRVHGPVMCRSCAAEVHRDG